MYQKSSACSVAPWKKDHVALPVPSLPLPDALPLSHLKTGPVLLIGVLLLHPGGPAPDRDPVL